MDDQTKNLYDIIFQGIQLLVIVISGLWAYFRYIRENPNHPRLEFNVDCQFFGPIYNSYLTSFTITVNNKDYIEHKFSEIRLKVLGIKTDEPLNEFKDYPQMVKFPEVIIKGVNIVPSNIPYLFVRPSLSQAFNYTTKIPSDIRFIVVRATFKYPSHKNELHTAERVFEVKNG